MRLRRFGLGVLSLLTVCALTFDSGVAKANLGELDGDGGGGESGWMYDPTYNSDNGTPIYSYYDGYASFYGYPVPVDCSGDVCYIAAWGANTDDGHGFYCWGTGGPTQCPVW